MFKKTDEGLKTFSLLEYPKTICLEDIWKHPDIEDVLVNNFKNYCDEAKREKQIRVQYIMYKPFGRYFVKDTTKISSCPMWGELRANLFKETEDDVDIIGCHQSLLYDILKEKPDTYWLDTLKRYVNHRNEIFDEIQIAWAAISRYNNKNKKKDTKTKRDCCKALFTILLYGGTTNTWANEFGFHDDDYVLSPFVSEFTRELKTNTAIIVNDKRFIDIIEWKTRDLLALYQKYHPIKPTDKRKIKVGIEYYDVNKYYRNDSKIVAIILQDYERKIVEASMDFVKSMTGVITSYNYDGFQILKHEQNEARVELLNNHIATLDLNDGIKWDNIKFIIKPFKAGLDLSKIPKEKGEFSLDEFYASSDYEWNKEYFEKYHFKCLNPSCFVKILKDGEPQYIGIEKINGMYKELKSTYWKDGKFAGLGSWSFMEKWTSDKDIKVYSGIDFYPKPLKPPDNHYNIWNNFPIEKTELDPDADTSRIHKHFLVMANNQFVVKEYLLNWFAHLVQKPATKTLVCILLQGQQGAGKSLLAEKIMNLIIGKSKMFITSKIDKVFGRFSNMQGRLLVILNEASGYETHALDSVLKDGITADSVQLEKKGIDSVDTIDYSNYIFTTNGFNSVKIPEDDRRFVAIACSNEMKDNVEYFNALYKDIENPVVMRKFYQELMKRPLEDFNASRDRPKTELYAVLQQVNRPYIDVFIENRQRDNDYERQHLPEIYEKFVNWWHKEGRRDEARPSSQKFSGMMRYNEQVIFERLETGNTYTIKKKKWLGGDVL